MPADSTPDPDPVCTRPPAGTLSWVRDGLRIDFVPHADGREVLVIEQDAAAPDRIRCAWTAAASRDVFRITHAASDFLAEGTQMTRAAASALALRLGGPRPDAIDCDG